MAKRRNPAATALMTPDDEEVSTTNPLPVQVTDGADGQTVVTVGSVGAAHVAIVDGSGNQITSFGGGTQYTEDDAAAANPVGTAPILVRADTPAGAVTTDGDNVAARGTNFGAAYVTLLDSSGNELAVGGGTQYTESDTDASITGTAFLMEGAANTLLPVQGTVADGLLVNLGANNDVAVTSLPALPAGTNNIGDVDVASIAAGDNNIGNVDVVTLPALVAGAAAIGKLLPPDIDVTTHTNYAKKYYTSTGAATDGIVWSPAAGKRWHVVSMYLQTSAAATITLEDDLTAGDSAVWKGEFAANQGMTINFGEHYPLASGEDAADLLITTSGGNVFVTCVGYEV